MAGAGDGMQGLTPARQRRHRLGAVGAYTRWWEWETGRHQGIPSREKNSVSPWGFLCEGGGGSFRVTQQKAKL